MRLRPPDALLHEESAMNSADAALIDSRSRPVLWWAAIGGLFAALQAYVFLAWMLSPDFTPTPTGPDPLPLVTHIAIIVIQILTPIGALVSIVYAVRTSRAQGQLSWHAIVMLAWAMLYWTDPISPTWFRANFSYNSHFFNMGSWARFVPGSIVPNGHLMPEPLLAIGPQYLFLGVVAATMTAKAMRWAKLRWLQIGGIQLVLVGCAAGALFDLGNELPFCRLRLYAYPGAISPLSLFPGTIYQWPVYEAAMFGVVFAAAGILDYFRDARGYTAIERGLDRVKAKWLRPVLRVLALAAVLNLLVITYNLLFAVISVHHDAYPADLPSYLRNGICGAATDYACPSPQVPIPLPGSGPQPPALYPRQLP